MSPRVLLDTSVLIPALFDPDNASRELLQRLVRICWTVVISDQIEDEAVEGARKKGRNAAEIARRLGYLRQVTAKFSHHVVEVPAMRTYPIHPSDQHVCAAAEQAGAAYLVHKNPKDFGRVRERLRRRRIRVIGVRRALEVVPAEPAVYEPPPALNWLFPSV